MYLVAAILSLPVYLVSDPFIEQDAEEEDTSRRPYGMPDYKGQYDDEEDQSPEQIAKNLSLRYARRGAVRYTGDMNEVPQRLLMPSVHDASLWQVRVKVCTTLLS